MILSRSDYPCQFSNVAFTSIIDDMNKTLSDLYHNSNCYVFFIDGDSPNVSLHAKKIYLERKRGKNIFMVTLTARKKNYSTIINHLSDLVVCKKASYSFLKEVIEWMLKAPPKDTEDYFLGDIWGNVLKGTQKEYEVLDLLFKGYTQNQIAKILNLSVTTVSGYKMKAVRRHGLRTFNELYIQKFKNNINIFDT